MSFFARDLRFDVNPSMVFNSFYSELREVFQRIKNPKERIKIANCLRILFGIEKNELVPNLNKFSKMENYNTKKNLDRISATFKTE